MAVKWVKIREKIAALVALVVVFLVVCLAAAVFGWNIPIISDVAARLGMTSIE